MADGIKKVYRNPICCFEDKQADLRTKTQMRSPLCGNYVYNVLQRTHTYKHIILSVRFGIKPVLTKHINLF